MVDHTVVLFLAFKEISILFFIVAVSIYISTNCARGFSFLHILSSIYCFRVFDDGHSDQCEVTLHCSFDFHFSNNEQCWVFFPVYWPCILWRNVCLGLLQFFDCFFFSVSCFICSYFLPFWRLSLHLVYGFLCSAKAFKFNKVAVVYFCFYFYYSRRWVIEDLAVTYVKVFSVVFSSKSFIVSGLHLSI